jgi:hypothetical protein
MAAGVGKQIETPILLHSARIHPGRQDDQIAKQGSGPQQTGVGNRPRCRSAVFKSTSPSAASASGSLTLQFAWNPKEFDMSGRKNRSGPPGHLRGARHPWKLFWKRKVIKPEHRWIVPFLEAYVHDLRADKPELTAGEARVLELAQISRGVILLILAECAQSGLLRQVKGAWELQPAAQSLSRFCTAELKALKLLGLQRHAKPITRLTELLMAVPSASEEAQQDG